MFLEISASETQFLDPGKQPFHTPTTIGDKILAYRFLFGRIIFGDYYRKLYSIIFLGGISCCNVRIGAVLPWKPRIFRLQLQFFSLCCVGINYSIVMPFLYRILFFQNAICIANPLAPYSFQKCPDPKLVKTLSGLLFFGVSVRGTQICQKLSKIEKRQFLDKSSNLRQIS